MVALDGTKVEANASLHANRGLEAIEREVQEMLADAAATDRNEDELLGRDNRGDELPEGLRSREGRLHFLPDDFLSWEEHPTAAAKRILLGQAGLSSGSVRLASIESFDGGAWHLVFHHVVEFPESVSVTPGENVAAAEWFRLRSLPDPSVWLTRAGGSRPSTRCSADRGRSAAGTQPDRHNRRDGSGEP